MAQIPGKYQSVENHNFKEFLIRGGVPEDKATIASDTKTALTVTVDGKKISLQTDDNLGNRVSELIVDEEAEEKFPWGTWKSFSTLNGNVLTVTSKGTDGALSGKRTYTFSASGLEVVYARDSDDFTAKKIYKRL